MSDQVEETAAEGPPIVRMGDPVLRRIAAEVADPTAPEIRGLIADMTVSLAEAGGIGLAAPQIGVGLRVILFKVPDARATGDPDDGPCPLTALVNPSFTPVDDEMALGWEGSLDPGFTRRSATASADQGHRNNAGGLGFRGGAGRNSGAGGAARGGSFGRSALSRSDDGSGPLGFC